MAALYNEIAFYARSSIKFGLSVLLIQKEDCLSKKLSDYKTRVCQTDDVFNLVSKSDSFDAIIALYQFGGIKEDERQNKFLSNVISVLKTDGHLIICENTGPPNPSLGQYTEKFEHHGRVTIGDTTYGLQLMWATCLRDSIHRECNWNNHCWLLQKCENLSDRVEQQSQRRDMDSYNFCDFFIKSYEWVYGEGCLTNGGRDFMVETLLQLKLQPFETMLDVACGTGGSSMYAAEEYGVNVVGLDVSANVLGVACERASSRKDSRVSFVMADVTMYDFPPASFDAIYCRDAMMYMEKKADLLKKYFVWLKPGGRILFTDYLVPENGVSKSCKEYLRTENYTLASFVEYEKLVKEAGFKITDAAKITDRMKRFFEQDLSKMKAGKADFIKVFSAEQFDYTIREWPTELHFIDSGQIEYGLFKAYKENDFSGKNYKSNALKMKISAVSERFSTEYC